MSDDNDRQRWQAEQAARDHAIEKQREKDRKARERSARNAKRKLERLHRTLKESGEITDWEDEFSESVTERLDKYGSAFNDREKGRPGDALSFSQKRVLSSLNKKVKDAKKAKHQKRLNSEGEGGDQGEDDIIDEPRRTRYKSRNGFKSKGKPKFTPRVRHIEDDFVEPEPPSPKRAPFIPEFVKETSLNTKNTVKSPPTASPKAITKPKGSQNPARPSFLRLVKTENTDDDNGASS